MDFEYSGLKLTPNILADILIELFDGKQFERQDALNKIQKYFVEHGGIIEEKSYAPTFKAAAKRLKERGLVNKGYGIWILNYEKQGIEIEPSEDKDEIVYHAEKELGTGNTTVYVYYYDVYEKLARFENKEEWPCKIGRTDRDPIFRVFSQSGTSYPEKPRLALFIHCEDSSKLEQALHSILKYRGKWISDAPGTEWFLTSPAIIEDIYANLLA